MSDFMVLVGLKREPPKDAIKPVCPHCMAENLVCLIPEAEVICWKCGAELIVCIEWYTAKLLDGTTEIREPIRVSLESLEGCIP